MSLRKLTDEERNFAASNHPLVYYFLKKKGLTEEMYDVVIFGYLKAVMIYFEKKPAYSFSTIAFWHMKRVLQAYYRYNKAQKRKAWIISLDAIKDGYRENNYPVYTSEHEDVNLLYGEFSKINLNRVQNKALSLLISGYSQTEISGITGISVRALQRLLTQLRLHLRRKLKDKKTFSYMPEKDKIKSIKRGEPFIFNNDGKMIRTLPVISIKKKRNLLIVETGNSIYEFGG